MRGGVVKRTAMFERFHYRNIYIGKYTSLAGASLVLLAGYMIVTGKVSMTEGVPLLLTGFGLLGTKDPKRTRRKKSTVKHEQPCNAR